MTNIIPSVHMYQPPSEQDHQCRSCENISIYSRSTSLISSSDDDEHEHDHDHTGLLAHNAQHTRNFSNCFQEDQDQNQFLLSDDYTQTQDETEKSTSIITQPILPSSLPSNLPAPAPRQKPTRYYSGAKWGAQTAYQWEMQGHKQGHNTMARDVEFME